MGVDRQGGFAKRDIEHHIGGFSADARQRFQCGALVRDLAAVALDQHPAGFQQMFGLAAIESDRGNVRFKAFLAERQNGLRRIGDRKKFAGGFVHADIGGLCRKQYGGQ